MKFPRTAFRCLTFSTLFLLSMVTAASAAEKLRSCAVKEVLKGGIYVYLRCQENANDIWLATVAREFKIDEVISFVNAPPMNFFYSKYLNRTFPEVIFTDLLPPAVTKK